MRKKNTVDVTDADAAANLQEDEEIVLQETRTIRKNKRKPTPEPEAAPEIDDEEDYGEIVEEFAPFKPGTIAYQLWNRNRNPDQAEDHDEIAELGTGNILVIRKPDSPADKFITPCTFRASNAPLRNVDFSEMTENDIEEMTRSIYGGGHYYLQMQVGNKMLHGWSCSLNDSPDAIERAAAAKRAAENPAPAPVVYQTPQPETPVNHLQQRIDELRLEREYDDLKFGPERERMRKLEDELSAMRDQIAKGSQQQGQSETIQILREVLAAKDSTLTEKVVSNLFPGETENTAGHWAVDLFKTVMDNKAELLAAAGALMGGITPPQQAAAAGLDSLLRSQPPGALPPAPPPPIPRTNLQRHRPAAAIDETDEAADEVTSEGKAAETEPEKEGAANE